MESPYLEAQRYGRWRKGRGMEEETKETKEAKGTKEAKETKEAREAGGWEKRCRWAKNWGYWSKIFALLSGFFRYCLLKSVMNPNQLIFSGAILMGLAALLRLALGFRKNGLCCRFLGLYFLLFTLFSINNLLIEIGLIQTWPIFWGSILPLYFVPAPLIYLYVRNISTGKTFTPKTDWIHFIPAILSVVYLLPFYLANRSEKLALMETFLTGDEPSFYQPALILFGLFYLLLILARLAAFKLDVEKLQTTENRSLFRWLVFFAALYTLFWFGNSIYFISNSFPDQRFFVSLKNLGTSITLIVSVFAFLLNTRPQLLQKLNRKQIV